ncbi:hypothetical protein K435DRAFT_772306 [Dendrothele bispora CBS 962.96]|uniref:MICOS complex subunit n=1 Tax=Dendrothele bispora (strain CBS 962.96) TaxID=1314807 RepID=A0A4S8MXX9_DENBC|nr:hypothetical protein K435DRAFT_772306 [Dendrothele bispora CBS 962.96]
MFAARRLPKRIGAKPLILAATAITLSTEKEKLSIYPAPDPEVVVQEVPSELENQIGVVRRHVTAAYVNTHTQVQGLVSKWIGVEHAVEHRVKAIISPEESLTPGILYVGVATLTGSIIARNRMLPIRFLLPPTFLALSMNHFLPKTTANLSEYLSSVEETYFPNLAEKHAIANAHSRMTWERLKDATASGRASLYSGVESAVEKVQEATGLKLKETLGFGREVSQKAEGRVMEAVKVAQQKAEEAKVAAESKLEEAKAEAEKKVEEVKKLV